jgi:hypothetical protein
VLALIIFRRLLRGLLYSMKGHAIKILNFVLKLKRSHCARTVNIIIVIIIIIIIIMRIIMISRRIIMISRESDVSSRAPADH